MKSVLKVSVWQGELAPFRGEVLARGHKSFHERMLQIGEVLWIIATHTLYIVVLVILVAMVDHLLSRLGMAERSVPIPFFPHTVPLEDALTLLDLCIIVLLYLIALKEIAELYGLFGEEEEGS